MMKKIASAFRNPQLKSDGHGIAVPSRMQGVGPQPSLNECAAMGAGMATSGKSYAAGSDIRNVTRGHVEVQPSGKASFYDVECCHSGNPHGYVD